jgi:acyl-CoA reductase-like NAD-dependent aldehyde dehydrogenase
MSPSERGRLIWKLAALLEENLDEFAELETLDNGKPLKIAHRRRALCRGRASLHGRLGH